MDALLTLDIKSKQDVQAIEISRYFFRERCQGHIEMFIAFSRTNPTGNELNLLTFLLLADRTL